MSRTTHADWREVFPSQQSRFHRFAPLSPSAAVLFHIDRIRHESPDPIFPYLIAEHRQFQWFEDFDELAGYLLHVVQWEMLCDADSDRDVLLHRDERVSAFKKRKEGIPHEAEDQHRTLARVAAAIGGPEDELMSALDRLPHRMGRQQIFKSAADAMRWVLAELPEVTEFGEDRADPRPDAGDLTGRRAWQRDAENVAGEKARSRTASRFKACSDFP